MPTSPLPRRATLVLCDGHGKVLGQLPPITALASPFWPEVDELVTSARARWGLEVVVLRLLTTEAPYAGGAVSYLAQLVSGSPPPTLVPAVSPESDAALRSDPAHRLWWAEPGGLDDLTAWVDQALAVRGRERTGPLRQRRTWNLSLVVTAPTASDPVWMKAVSPFLADEGGVMARVARIDPGLPPTVLAHDPTRRAVLMDHVPGEDQWGLADDGVIRAMVDRWVDVQAALVDDVEHCLAVGAADGRSLAVVESVRALLWRPEIEQGLTAGEFDAFEDLADNLARRLEKVEECGLPDTLVHGDLHPGNWRRDGAGLTLLDWGDVRVGNPVLDLRAFVERLDGPGLQERTTQHWVGAWRRAVPGSDPERAMALLAPVAQLVAAAHYQYFLDNIEATERVYHRLDPVDRLRAALQAAGLRAS
ncbi:MAG: phosphotransferase [Lapillicoccus sp.]